MRRACLLAVVLILTMTACTGREVKRPTPEFPVLGRTTRAEVVALYGEPRQEGTTVLNGSTLQQVLYVHTPGGAEPVTPGVVMAQGLIFTFHEARVVGYNYLSTVKGDATDFDAAKAEQLIRGQTRQETVLQLFGPPTGRAIPPAVQPGRTGWFYAYEQSRRRFYQTPQQYVQRLAISFDDHGVVQDYQLTINGAR